jgi:hypothetical protein
MTPVSQQPAVVSTSQGLLGDIASAPDPDLGEILQRSKRSIQNGADVMNQAMTQFNQPM